VDGPIPPQKPGDVPLLAVLVLDPKGGSPSDFKFEAAGAAVIGRLGSDRFEE
jgi:hypothetical protein